jgi:hypothetical protein
MADEELLSPLVFEEAEQSEAVETVETEAPQEVAAQKEPEPKQEATNVPLAALQEVRAENKTLKERLAEMDNLKAVVAAMAQAPRAPVQPPDMFQEPEAYQAFVAQQVQAQVSNVTAEMSERFARLQHGDDFISEAFEAAKAKGVVDGFRGRKDPWGELARWHKSQKALAEIGDDPAAFRERVEQEIRSKLQAEMAAQSVKSIPSAPSLAGQPNLSARNPTGWAGPAPLSDALGSGGSF